MLVPGNRVYIASKINLMEARVLELKRKLMALGYVVPYDWTEHPVPKPFKEHRQAATRAAEAMAHAVMECDILVVLCADNGLGYHIETGGALVAGIVSAFIAGQNRKRIFVTGQGNDGSVFYFHESVVRLQHEDEVLTILPRLKFS